jgi:hypothetical protein
VSDEAKGTTALARKTDAGFAATYRCGCDMSPQVKPTTLFGFGFLEWYRGGQCRAHV